MLPLSTARGGYVGRVGRMRGTEERPAGLEYATDVLSAEEEHALLAAFDRLDLQPVSMRGQKSRRTVRHFGFDYGYESWDLRPGDPIPGYLHGPRARCAGLAGIEPDAFEQALVTCYPAGASIGWHRDASAFGPVVAGLSLGTACVMRFQRRAADCARLVFEQPLEPRSAYVLGGAARSAWQHSIPAVDDVRYSVTFRTVRSASRPPDR